MQKPFFEIVRDYFDKAMLSLPNTQNTCPVHFHRQLEGLYVLNGANLVTINDKKQLLTEHQMCIADSFDTHSYQTIDNGESIVFIIPYGCLRNFIKTKDNKVLSTNFITDTTVSMKFYSVLNTLHEYWNCNNPLLINGLFDYFLGMILQYIPLQKSQKNHLSEKSHLILYYLEENYKQNITMESTAKHFGYSKVHFSAIFNNLFHCHFNEYVNMLRLRQAIYLLQTTETSILNAALDAGFTSIPTFYRVFKRINNTDPTEYLSNANKNVLEDLSRFSQYELASPQPHKNQPE